MRIGWLGALLLAGPAWASDTQYHDYPVGGRAVGLGGAFTAIANDVSGLYYNPAGLVDGRHDSVQISTNFYGLEINGGLLSAFESITDLDTVFSQLNVIPSTAGFTKTFGKNAEGITTEAFGVGVFVPSYRGLNLNQVADLSTTAGLRDCQQRTYQRNLLDRTFLAAAGFGHRLDDILRFGAALQLSYRTLSDSEEVTCFGLPQSGDASFWTTATDVELAVASLMLNFGVQVTLDNWRFGASVTSPGIRAFDTAQIRVRRVLTDPATDTSQFLVREVGEVVANTKQATNLRLGAAYIWPRKATVSVDLVVHAGTRYQLFELPPGEASIASAITQTTNVTRRPVANLAVGGEYLILNWLSVAAGLYTNFGSAPRIPGNNGDFLEADQLTRLDALGATGVLGFFSDYTLTRVGGSLSYGWGSDVVPTYAGFDAPGAATAYQKTELQRILINVFVSSTFRY